MRVPHISLFAAALAAFALIACTSTGLAPEPGRGSDGNDPGGTGGSGASGGGPSGLPCEVDALLKSRCQSCHAREPLSGASTPLVTHEDLGKSHKGQKVSDLVLARVKDAARPMPPLPNKALTPQEISTLEGWVKAGMPKGQSACGGAAAPPVAAKPLSCKPDLSIRAKTPFTLQPGGETDQYVCLGLDVQRTKKRHVLAAAPHIDNTKILHHILLFQADKSQPATPTPCSAFGSASWKLVGGWAPGGENIEFPQEAGFPEPQGTTHWVIQIHYNNAGTTTPQADASGFDLCTTEQLRPNDAGLLAFGAMNFQIPPRAQHKETCRFTLDNKFRNVKFFSASPHMHKLGTSMATVRLAGGNGAPETVFEQKAFDFANQLAFPISMNVNPGDVIQTTCGWNNATDRSVGFGEGTGDEMCYNFIGYFPAIPDQTLFGFPIFTWVTPSLVANCN